MRYYDEERNRPNPPNWGGIEALKPVVTPEAPRTGPTAFESFHDAVTKRDMNAAMTVLRTESEADLSSKLAGHLIDGMKREMAREKADRLKANPSYGADFAVMKAEMATFSGIKAVECEIARRTHRAIVQAAHVRMDALPEKAVKNYEESLARLKAKWAAEDSAKQEAVQSRAQGAGHTPSTGRLVRLIAAFAIAASAALAGVLHYESNEKPLESKVPGQSVRVYNII